MDEDDFHDFHDEFDQVLLRFCDNWFALMGGNDEIDSASCDNASYAPGM